MLGVLTREQMNTISIQDALTIGTQMLKETTIDLPNLDARILLKAATGKTTEAMIATPHAALTPQEFQQYLQLLARRQRHEPTAYITGKKSFWSLDFDVTCATLIPRPDSETLVETALGFLKHRSRPYRIVDVGTGSGCLLLSLLSEFPSATGIGVDVSEEALSVAMRNASKLGMAHRTEWLHGRWLEPVAALHDDSADLIISNPPYIASAEIATLARDVAGYEPRLALDGGADGMDPYRVLAAAAKPILARDGVLIVEIGAGQCEGVTRIFNQHAWERRHMARDLAGIERCLVFTKQ